MIKPRILILGIITLALFLAGWLYYALVIRDATLIKDSLYMKAKESYIARMRLAREFEKTRLYKFMVILPDKINKALNF